MPESILFLCGQEPLIDREILEELLGYYQSGTKIFGIFSNKHQIESLVEVLDQFLSNKGLARHGQDLISFSSKPEVVMDRNRFLMYHGSFHLWALPSPTETKILVAEEIGAVLPMLEKYALTFDVAQFCAIEDGQGHHILVEGMGGTGKTRVLLSRFLFLWKNTELEQDVFLQSTKIIVFHHTLKVLYREFIRKELENSFLLTDNEKYSRMLSAVHKIQFNTVNELLCETLIENGHELEIVENEDLLREIISQTTQVFIVENPEKMSEMQRLNLTFSQVERHIFKLVMQIYGEKLDLKGITASSFGGVKKGDPYGGIKLFYHESAIKIAHLWKETLISLGKLHNIQLVSHFLSIERHCGREKFLFIDDLHLATDGEIEAIYSYLQKKETLLFVCQNRGETKLTQSKNSFFQCFFGGNQLNLWKFFTLKHQYRMDENLHQIFQNIFLTTNQIIPLENYNEYLTEFPAKYYNMSRIYQIDDEMVGIYDEIKRLERRFAYEQKHNMQQKEQLNSFAIVVDSTKKVTEIVCEFEGYGYEMCSNHGINQVLQDLQDLIRAIFYIDDAVALYQLLESNFFALSVPKSNLYLISQENQEGNGVVSYMRRLIGDEFEKNQEEKLTWDSFQEKLFYNLEYLKYFYDVMTPWERCDKSKKERYRNNVEYLLSYIEKKGILTLSDLELEIQSGKIQFPREKSYFNVGMELYCYTKEECVGREFGHILLVCSEETRKKDLACLLRGKDSIFAYRFSLDFTNDALTSEFFQEIIQKFDEKQIISLYNLMSKCQYSFSWLSVKGKQVAIEERILEKGLDRNGL